jgi:hypothetical protein
MFGNKHLGLSHMMVARVWAKHGLKPHRMPGRAERLGFEYHRHGTLSPYAAFETRTGRSWAGRPSGTRRRSLSPS